MPGVVTPLFSITHLHTHNEREMEGENVFFRERCSAVPVEKEEPPKLARNSTFSRRPWRNLAPRSEHTIWHGSRRSCWTTFQPSGGCVAAVLVSVSNSPDPQKSTKVDFHCPKCRNHSAPAQHMMRRKARRKFWCTTHTFRGFAAVPVGNNPL